MAAEMIEPERVVPLNDLPPRRGKFVLYWMQASQRAHCNHALEFAIEQANARREPVAAVFGLTESFPRANLRHYTFMLQGLQETQADLHERGIQLAVLHARPPEAALLLADQASLIITDCGYLRIQRQWREELAERSPCQVMEVEGDVVVPVELASPKEEYSARTLRPKLQRHLRRFLRPLEEKLPRRDSLGFRLHSAPLGSIEQALSPLNLDRSVRPVNAFRGGPSHARRWLDEFLALHLKEYAHRHSDPSCNCVSHMSPYLHFGQISPLCVALAVQGTRGAPASARAAYLEELIVRRELSMNFVHYNAQYDSFDSLPAWARKTLLSHSRRKDVYSAQELEQAQTSDDYWNAAQMEMVLTGKMHGYMRMYWGKRILEWIGDPREAYRLAIELNDKYELDGRDPNSYAGVAWCFGKHDRPFAPRPVFGTIRTMNSAGLERKFDMGSYLAKIRAMQQTLVAPVTTGSKQ